MSTLCQGSMRITRPSPGLSMDIDSICRKYQAQVPLQDGCTRDWEPLLRAANQHHLAVFNRRTGCLGCWYISTRAHHTLNSSSFVVPLLPVAIGKLIPKSCDSRHKSVVCGCGSAQSTCRVCRKPFFLSPTPSIVLN